MMDIHAIRLAKFRVIWVETQPLSNGPVIPNHLGSLRVVFVPCLHKLGGPQALKQFNASVFLVQP
jgi:hypothetical protein